MNNMIKIIFLLLGVSTATIALAGGWGVGVKITNNSSQTIYVTTSGSKSMEGQPTWNQTPVAARGGSITDPAIYHFCSGYPGNAYVNFWVFNKPGVSSSSSKHYIGSANVYRYCKWLASSGYTYGMCSTHSGRVYFHSSTNVQSGCPPQPYGANPSGAVGGGHGVTFEVID